MSVAVPKERDRLSAKSSSPTMTTLTFTTSTPTTATPSESMADEIPPGGRRETVAYVVGMCGILAIAFAFKGGLVVGPLLIVVAAVIYPRAGARAKMNRKSASRAGNQPASSPLGPDDDPNFLAKL
jgi:hypothetical protein